MEIYKIMFDTNAYDKARKNISLIRRGKKQCEYYITEIQIKEVASIPDNKKEERKSDLLSIVELRPRIVPIPFSFDYISFAHFSFNVCPDYWHILKKSKANRNDALIAATAIYEGCTLVTDDKELIKKMVRLGKDVVTFDEFLQRYIIA